jgi:hypothetical protein
VLVLLVYTATLAILYVIQCILHFGMISSAVSMIENTWHVLYCDIYTILYDISLYVIC